MSEENSVKFHIRSEENNNTTHDNKVDNSIESASLWRTDRLKHCCALFCFTASLGIVYLFTFLFPKLQLLLTCRPCKIQDAEYLVVIDNNGKMHILIITREDYLDNNITLDDLNEIKGSLYYQKRNMNLSQSKVKVNETDEAKSIKESDSEPLNELNEKIVFYLLNKYRYDYRIEAFVPIDMDLSSYSLNELHRMKNGLPTQAVYDYLRAYYPTNDISVKDHSTFSTVCRTCFSFFNLYSLYCIGIWAWGGYWEFSVIVAALNVILIMITLSLWRSNLKSVINFNSKANITIRRGYMGDTEQESSSIVPGDIILLKQRPSKTNEKKEIIVPCDGLLIEGYCTVDESDLTGENTLVLKKELPNNEEKFLYKRVVHSFLYQGTRISSLFSRRMTSNADCNQIAILATNTGYNTYRGDMIQNWQFQKPEENKLNSDQKVVTVFVIILWVSSIIPMIFVYLEDGEALAMHVFDSLTTIVPPTLFISITFATFYFNHLLRRKDISCLIDKKMNSAGLIKRIVLDKTGTLTESQLDIYCFQTTRYNAKGELSLDLKEFSPSTLNKTYKLFWKTIYREYHCIDTSYQESFMNNLIYFVECLASCHEVYKIRSEIIGNSIDQKIFIQMNWEMIQEDPHDMKSQIRIEPHNAYKITENVNCDAEEQDFLQQDLTMKQAPSIAKEEKSGHSSQYAPKPNFYLQYLKRYEFSSLSQSLSVVVKNSLDGTVRLYMKGAPERIQIVCALDSIPIDLKEKLRSYTKDGYRVFACATRILQDWDKNIPVEHYQRDMTFLGLIVFDNPIKKDTKEYIQHLLDSNCKISIATGDNVFTTISVAQQCDIIKKNANVFMIESFEENLSRGITLASTAKLERANEHEDSDSNALDNTIKDNDVGFDEMVEAINKDFDAVICSSGSALIHLLKNRDKSDTMKLLTTLIRLKGVIFFRMIPAEKSQLVSFFQEDKTLVVMCGDGANDCKALMTADVGVAINQSNTKNLICHFSSRKDSIECLELILMTGRAFYENNIFIFKALLITSAIQETTVVLLNASNRELSNIQFLYLDSLCVLVPMILAPQTQAASKLSSFPQQKLTDYSSITGILCQIIIHIGGQVGYYYYIDTQVFNDSAGSADDILNSYLAMFSIFQILSSVFIFNFFSLQRKRFFSNKPYLIYFAVIIYLTINSMTKSNFVNVYGVIAEDDSEAAEINLERNQVITIFWIVGLAVVSFILETVIYYCFSRKKETDQEEVKRKVNEAKQDVVVHTEELED